MNAALEMLKQRDDRHNPDILVYNSALEIFLVHGGVNAAQPLFDYMLSRHFLNVASFNMMIRAFVRAKPNDLAVACSVMQLMKDLGVSPDEVSYNSVISSAVSTGQMDLAWDLVDDMERTGVPVRKNEVSCCGM